MSVFVTVGTTSFDDLIQVVTSEEVKKILETKGYNKLIIQYGRGEYEVENLDASTFTVEAYRYKDSLAQDIKNAEIVISHAGAGTCLEVLEANRPLVVVVNEKLMNNHQFELAKQLCKDGHLLYCTCSSLLSTLTEMDVSSLKPLPPPKTAEFVNNLSSYLGVR